MRKSLRTKRGGTRDKKHTESKAEKSGHKPIQKTMTRSKYSPPPSPPSDIETMTVRELNDLLHKQQVIAHKSNNTSSDLSLADHYFQGGPSYFKPTRKQVSEILNTKK
jgi:hypothetical protein